MHPDVQRDRPGKCPKCGMDLVAKNRGQRQTKSHEGDGHEDHKMTEHEEHGAMPEMTREMRRPWLWTNSTLMALGLWLLSSPFTFGYAGSRMAWNDGVS